MALTAFRRALCIIGVFAVSLFGLSAVSAQGYSQGDRVLDTQLFRPGIAQDDILNVRGSAVPAHGEFVLGAYMTYLYRPLRTVLPGSPDVATVVDHQLAWELMGGIAFWDRVMFHVAVPFSMWQSCLEQTGTGSCDGALSSLGLSDKNFEGGGFGDVRFELRGTIVRREAKADGFGLGAGGVVSFPTADATAFVGESNFSDIADPTSGSAFRVTGALYLAADYRLGPWRFAANSGVLLRQTSGGAFATRIDLGHELLYGVGGAYAFTEWLEGLVEFDGRLGLSSVASHNSPHEVLIAARFHLPAGFRVDTGVGLGVMGDYGAPDVRWFGGLTYTGNIFALEKEDDTPDYLLDTDGDGIPDYLDRCPTVFALTPDGCPLPEEEAPTPAPEPEMVAEEDLDLDELPEVAPPPVVVTAERITLDERIEFTSGRAELTAESRKVLSAVADVLNATPSVRMVRIEGHTDSLGSAAVNKRLSQLRAEAVMRSLVQQGVDQRRLQAVGYGSSRPIAGNDTAEGRAQNRRVEFIIVDQGQ